MSKHSDPKGRTSGQSEQYDPKHAKGVHQGQHRAEDRSRSTQITRSDQLTSGQYDPNAPR